MRWVLHGGRVWDGEAVETSPSPLSIWVDSGQIASLGTDPGGEGWEPVQLPAEAVVIQG